MGQQRGFKIDTGGLTDTPEKMVPLMAPLMTPILPYIGGDKGVCVRRGDR